MQPNSTVSQSIATDLDPKLCGKEARLRIPIIEKTRSAAAAAIAMQVLELVLRDIRSMDVVD